MDFIPLAMIVGYLAGTTLLGAALARRSRSSSDWAVAGGGMGIGMIACGVAGTRVGGVATYGVAGDVIQTGMWNMWYGVNSFLAMALVGVFFAVPYRRLQLHTVGEIFTRRFGARRSQVLTSLCVQTEYFIVNLIEIFVIAKILQGIFPNLALGWGVAISASIIIGYTALGGLWGSSATNVIHCAAIIFGLLAVAVVGTSHLGGWDAVRTKIDAALAASGKDRAAWWSLSGAGWGAIVAMFFSATIHTPAASIYVNYSTAARDEKSVMPAFILGGVLAAPMSWIAGWIGALSLARYGAEAQVSGYKTIAPLAFEINPWLGGVAMAAILAAVVSSGGPILLASATMFVRDWLPFTKDYEPKKLLATYRLATVIYGLLAAAIVLWAKKIAALDLLLLGFAAVVPPAIAAGYLIYWKRTTEAGAFWGILAGYVGGILWFGAIKWAGAAGLAIDDGSGLLHRAAYICFAQHGEGIDPSYATTIIPLVAIPVISLLGGAAKDESGGEAFYRQARGKAAA